MMCASARAFIFHEFEFIHWYSLQSLFPMASGMVSAQSIRKSNRNVPECCINLNAEENGAIEYMGIIINWWSRIASRMPFYKYWKYHLQLWPTRLQMYLDLCLFALRASISKIYIKKNAWNDISLLHRILHFIYLIKTNAAYFNSDETQP